MLLQINSVVSVPGLNHALVFDWNGDNAGPYSAATYIEHFKSLQAMFPGAQVGSEGFRAAWSGLAAVVGDGDVV